MNTSIPANAKQPQDRLPAAQDFPDTVTVQTSKGELVLPHFSKVPGGALRKARKCTDELDQFYMLLEITLGDPSPELDLVDTLTLIEQGRVFSQWTQGAPVGESSSSEN